MISSFCYCFGNNATNMNVNLNFGICSSSGTNPASNTPVNSISLNNTITNPGSNTSAYFPTFPFAVTTSGYYYCFITAVSGSYVGTSYGIGTRLINLVRIA